MGYGRCRRKRTGKVPEELENDTEEAHALSYDEVKEKMDDSEE